MTRTIGDRQDNQGRQLKRWASVSTANGTPQWLRAALYHVRDHHEALLRPLKVLTREPQRVREATPEEERVLVRSGAMTIARCYYTALSAVCMRRDRAHSNALIDLRNRQIAFPTKRHRVDPNHAGNPTVDRCRKSRFCTRQLLTLFSPLLAAKGAARATMAMNGIL